MRDRRLAARGGAIVVGLLVVLALLLPRDFAELPGGAVVTSSASSFWKKSREYVYIDGKEWCAGSEWRALPVAVAGGRTIGCAEPGREGLVDTGIGDPSERLLLVSTAVVAVEGVSNGRTTRFAISDGTSAFRLVRVDTRSTVDAIRLVREAPSVSTEFACDDDESVALVQRSCGRLIDTEPGGATSPYPRISIAGLERS